MDEAPQLVSSKDMVLIICKLKTIEVAVETTLFPIMLNEGIIIVPSMTVAFLIHEVRSLLLTMKNVSLQLLHPTKRRQCKCCTCANVIKISVFTTTSHFTYLSWV